MKTCFFLVQAILASILLVSHASAQSTITIVGPPLGTRITDAETGQLVGTGYSAAIFWAHGSVIDRDAFVQLGATMTVVNGQLPGTTRSVPLSAPNSVNLFAAAWQTAAGATYEQASQVQGAKVGASEIVNFTLGGPAVRFPDFQVHPVPEPSTWALIAFGLLALTWRHVRARKP